jgi:hypothetical protein
MIAPMSVRCVSSSGPISRDEYSPSSVIISPACCLVFAPDRGSRFAPDSPLEGGGFELPVPLWEKRPCAGAPSNSRDFLRSGAARSQEGRSFRRTKEASPILLGARSEFAPSLRQAFGPRGISRFAGVSCAAPHGPAPQRR